MSGYLTYDENDDGMPIAGVGKKVLYMCSKTVDEGVNSIKLKGDLVFEPIINKKTEREVKYFSGPSGAGKSYKVAEYLKAFKKAYPKRDIFVFSSLPDCPTLDKVKGMKRIKINGDMFMTEPISASDFRDACVVWDDTDCITNKPVKLKVQKLMDECLQIGRHFNITCLITSHALCAGNATKMVLNESHTITIFPSCAGKRILDYLCVDYLGLSKQQISKLKKMDGRSVTFVRNYPRCVFSDNECVILKELS
jgi:hypothetical protein